MLILDTASGTSNNLGMTFPNRLLFPLFLSGLCCGWALPAELPPPATASIRQEYADAKYREVIRDVAKLTASKDWQVKKTDSYALWMLKANAHLQLKESALAASIYESAARNAPDKASAALARSNAYLIKHSVGLHYIPKATFNSQVDGGKPDDHPTIDIVDPEKRKEALLALWQDQKNSIDPLLAPALDADKSTVKIILEAIPVITRLRDFDLAAHGSDEETKKSADPMAEHAKALLTEMIDPIAARADAISSKALAPEMYKVQVPGSGIFSRYRRHGLEDKEPTELTEMLSKTEQITHVVTTLAEGLGTEKDYFEHVSKEAKRVHDKAQKTLKADYITNYPTRDAAMK